MDNKARLVHYFVQSGKQGFTPKQRRRAHKKLMRAQRAPVVKIQEPRAE